MRRVLTEQRAEVVDAGTAELVAEARERWSSSLKRAKGAREHTDPDESATTEG